MVPGQRRLHSFIPDRRTATSREFTAAGVGRITTDPMVGFRCGSVQLSRTQTSMSYETGCLRAGSLIVEEQPVAGICGVQADFLARGLQPHPT